MRPAEWTNVVFFSFLLALAWIGLLARAQRTKVTALAIAAVGVTLIGRSSALFLAPLASSVLRDWLPAPLLLMAYWQAGQFFTRAQGDFQAKLEELDHKLRRAFLGWVARERIDNWTAIYFELAYLLCYPLVPLGLGTLYIMHMGRYADKFWTVVLPPTYLCYAMLPFIQTLPPRMLIPPPEPNVPETKVRALNLWILRHASIQVNTFPSAHVAAATAASLALLCLARPLGWIFVWVAISIAVGAILGRYHYAADVILGAMLAVVVFLAEMRLFR